MLLDFALAAALQDDPFRIPLEGEDAPRAAAFDQAALDAKVAEILPRLEELRGWKFARPVAAGIQPVADFLAYAKAAVEEEYGERGLDGVMTSAVLFGFLPDGVDYEETVRDLLAASVGGYYEPDGDKFWIIEGFAAGPLAEILMAHELQHALDDQHYPLEQMLDSVPGDSDRGFALRGVIEGSATSAMNLYLARGVVQDWLQPAGLMSADMIGAQLAAMDKAPVALLADLMLPYLEGNVFLLRGGSILQGALRAPAEADLRRAFAEPPQSSEQILHPEKYWDPEHFDPPRAVELPDLSAELGAGWTSVDEDTLGELGCAMLAAPRLPTPLELQFGAGALRHAAAAGWGGDRYRSYRDGAGARAGHAVVVWDSADDASEFAAALADEKARARAPFLREVRVSGDRVELFLADEAGKGAAMTLARKP
jgi:hypothetical protein